MIYLIYLLLGLYDCVYCLLVMFGWLDYVCCCYLVVACLECCLRVVAVAVDVV